MEVGVFWRDDLAGLLYLEKTTKSETRILSSLAEGDDKASVWLQDPMSFDQSWL
jgi:hypothetical protein